MHCYTNQHRIAVFARVSAVFSRRGGAGGAAQVAGRNAAALGQQVEVPAVAASVTEEQVLPVLLDPGRPVGETAPDSGAPCNVVYRFPLVSPSISSFRSGHAGATPSPSIRAGRSPGPFQSGGPFASATT